MEILQLVEHVYDSTMLSNFHARDNESRERITLMKR